MTEDIIIIIAITVICFLVFIAGFVLAVCLIDFSEISQHYEEMYCFECEIEMPVKEKTAVSTVKAAA